MEETCETGGAGLSRCAGDDFGRSVPVWREDDAVGGCRIGPQGSTGFEGLRVTMLRGLCRTGGRGGSSNGGPVEQGVDVGQASGGEVRAAEPLGGRRVDGVSRPLAAAVLVSEADA